MIEVSLESIFGALQVHTKFSRSIFIMLKTEFEVDITVRR